MSKLNKLDFSQMMREMLFSYNQFASNEDLIAKVDAYYEKLKWQETAIIKQVMKSLSDEKMPNAAQILKKCLDHKYKVSKDTPMLPSEQICRYSHQDECAISRSLCGNWPITPEWAQQCLRDHQAVLCYWHWKVWKSQRAVERGEDADWWVDWMIDVKRNNQLAKPGVEKVDLGGVLNVVAANDQYSPIKNQI